MRKHLTEQEKKAILELLSKGLSLKAICKTLFGDKNKRRSTVYDFLKSINYEHNRKINVLLLDLETSPMKTYVWGRWNQNIYQDNVLSESFILTYAAKWLGADLVSSGSLTKEEVLKENDKRLVLELKELLNNADYVIAHNGDKFDIPFIKTRMIFHDIKPSSPFKQYDTLRVARRVFKFSSNKLNDLCLYLGLEGKSDNGGFLTWKGFLEGDQEKIDLMISYNIDDVHALERLYLKLRPYDNFHPNFSINLNVENVCPCCGAEEQMIKVDKLHLTNINRYEIWRCENCGKYSRKRKLINRDPVNFVGV